MRGSINPTFRKRLGAAVMAIGNAMRGSEVQVEETEPIRLRVDGVTVMTVHGEYDFEEKWREACVNLHMCLHCGEAVEHEREGIVCESCYGAYNPAMLADIAP